MILNALITIALRDVTKLVRDRARLVFSLVFPFVFIAILGGSLDANLSKNVGYDFMTFVFIGVLGQTLFQTTASGLISLIEDRDNDFAQELFVAPVPRLVILAGKILGETLVACAQLFGIFGIGLVLGVDMNFWSFLRILPAIPIVAFFGGAFGTLVMANLSDQRKANQIFPLLIFPQFFLAGVFTPMKTLPWHLMVLSRLAPMTYAVDFVRGLFYFGRPEFDKVVLHSPIIDLAIILAMTAVFLTVGTWIFVKKERER